MAGRTNKGRGGGGGSDSKPSGSGRGRGGYNRASKPTKSGLCKELEGNIFDFGERSSADLMRTTYNKIAHHVGIKFGGDIMKELEMKTSFVVPPPIYPASGRLGSLHGMRKSSLNKTTGSRSYGGRKCIFKLRYEPHPLRQT